MDKEKRNPPHFIDLQDLNKRAWLLLNGVDSQDVKRPDGLVVFRVYLDDEVQRLLAEYESNPMVPLLDFVAKLKRARGRMLDARNGNGGTEYGKENNHR